MFCPFVTRMYIRKDPGETYPDSHDVMHFTCQGAGCAVWVEASEGSQGGCAIKVLAEKGIR